jgi:hypothetical protein
LKEYLNVKTMLSIFLRDASWLNNGYYILKFKTTQWWLQQNIKIRMVRLIVLTGSLRLPNRLLTCILYLSEQVFN